ncbi:DUF7793 family protein [Mesonia maritima]|uniref:DUF7793 domain-containing protein n=1 Tax=Mesonia maritima TaxID=1793873 RepID=A0ABU1K896_9FLAO|nr:hypothetical protein [Mesonia maritima]MDR6301815.1 hypothetical protein [Mesonia maritima]
MHNFFKHSYAEMLLSNGILYFTYLPIGSFDENVARQLVAARLQLQREQAYPVLCDIRALSLPTKKARHYLAVEGSLLIKAVAYWVQPHSTQELTRFFKNINQPVVPSAIFTQRDEALTYLNQFIHDL